MLQVPRWTEDLPEETEEFPAELHDALPTIQKAIRTLMLQRCNSTAVHKAISAAKDRQFSPNIRLPMSDEPVHERKRPHEFTGFMQVPDDSPIVKGVWPFRNKTWWTEPIHEPESWTMLDGISAQARSELADILVRKFVTKAQTHFAPHIQKDLQEHRFGLRHGLSKVIGTPFVSSEVTYDFLDNRFHTDFEVAYMKAVSEGLLGKGLHDLHQMISGRVDVKTGSPLVSIEGR